MRLNSSSAFCGGASSWVTGLRKLGPEYRAVRSLCRETRSASFIDSRPNLSECNRATRSLCVCPLSVVINRTISWKRVSLAYWESAHGFDSAPSCWPSINANVRRLWANATPSPLRSSTSSQCRSLADRASLERCSPSTTPVDESLSRTRMKQGCVCLSRSADGRRCSSWGLSGRQSMR